MDKKIYIRLHTGRIFEPEVYQSSMEFEIVKKYYLALQAMIDVCKYINQKILELDI